jgi:hypothetical protein
MTVYEFNSKINLPSFCLASGIKGLQFKKIPKFGWFGFNEDKSVIVNIFQIFPEKSVMDIYRILTLDKPQYQESRMVYSELTDCKIKSSWFATFSYHQLLQAAINEAKEGKMYVDGIKVKVSNFLDEEGLPQLLANNVGVINSRIYDLKEFKHLGLNEGSKDKLLLPSYATPLHPCSFELVDPRDIQKRTELFTNREKGWYGQLGNCIVSDISELGFMQGNTWNQKCDFWNDKIINLSPRLNEEQCLRIWTEAHHTTFTKSPLDIILENKAEKNLHYYIKNLTAIQIKELEEKTNTQLIDVWKKQQEEEAQIGNLRFIRRNNRYYVERYNTVEQEYTNFAIKITKIKQRNGFYYQTGFVYYNDQEVPFEIEDKAFRSPNGFMNALRKFFLESSLGVPNVLPTYKHYLANVICKFNPEIEVDNS